jgi:hypothetical protein
MTARTRAGRGVAFPVNRVIVNAVLRNKGRRVQALESDGFQDTEYRTGTMSKAAASVTHPD